MTQPDRNSVDSSHTTTTTAEQARQTVVHRPTEGQLRWAQFHHRRRAQQVKRDIENLYQTPATIQQVEGALSDDGNSSTASLSTTDSPVLRPKPKVSRGRRALLRVSQRRYRARTEVIRERGFRRTSAGHNSSSSEEAEEGDDDALACIFAETTALKRRRRKKRHSDDRGKRFDQAFHALMMNVAASLQPQFAAVQTPTKIWTRPAVAETPMIQVDYDAMKQMGIPTNAKKSAPQTTALPMDRGASWLMHLPKTEKASNEARRVAAVANQAFAQAAHFTNDMQQQQQQGPPSPVRQRFRDIVADFQMKSIPASSLEPTHYGATLPTMRLQKYFSQLEDVMDEKKEEHESPLTATRLDYHQVQERIQSFEKSPPPPSDEDDLAHLMLSMDPDFLEEMEALNPGVKERLKALYLRESTPTVKQLARIIETPNTQEMEKPLGLVQDLVARMEKAARKESLISADGKLHKPTFAKLLNQYLMEAKGNAVSPRRRQPVLDSLVSKFQESEETDSIIDHEGNLDTPVLEHLVTRYLAELTGQDEDEVREAGDWESLQTEEYKERPPFIRDAARQMRQQVMGRTPQGEEEWCQVVEMSIVAALPQNEHVTPPSWAVRRLAERFAALVPEAWDQINTIEEVIEDELEEAQRIHEENTRSPPRTPVAVSDVSTPPAKISEPSPEVKNFLFHFEQAAEVEPLVQNGSFHLPTFTKLVNRYWIESAEDSADFSNARTPVLLARAKRSSVVSKAPAIEKSKSPGTIKRFLSSMELAIDDASLVDDDGALNRTELARLIAKELQNAAPQKEVNQDVTGDVTGNQGEDSIFGEESDFFSVIRRRFATELAAKSVVSELTFDSPRKSNPDEPSNAIEVAAMPHEGNEGTGRKAARNITGAVTNKVGGLFGRIFQQKDDSSVQRKDDLQAVAAYRKKQDERRLSDDTSSLSSFRALPDGIKNVVMNFRRISGAASEPAQISTVPSTEDYDNMSHQSDAISSIARSHSESPSDFSPERVKSFHKKVMEKSALIGGGEISKVLIDTDGSEASFDGVNPEVLASLLLSPTILTKRHQQAIRAIEKRKWDQVSYLISANPWLCEMTDLTTNQYLLHKLALYGGGESTVDRSKGEVLAVKYAPAPTELDIDMVRLFPSSVHKFDQDGNLPLHMACAAANVSMLEILGDRFPSGATVRNEDGLLPIHLVILACGSPRAVTYGDAEGSTALIRKMLDYFPASVAIHDNEGNLPIHTAASVLRGSVGVDVIHLLLDEASNQLNDPGGARFQNKIMMDDFDSSSQTVNTEPTDTPTEHTEGFDDITLCTMVCNDAGETPLMGAIHARCGWEVIDALVQGKGGQASALAVDRNRNNALHLLVGGDYQDPAAALSILKNAPETARRRNEDGMLPIEIACMQLHAPELILAIVLVDLPIELDSKDGVKVMEKQGSSWWYLVCESDDHFVDVVDEVISMCSYAQIRELCFMEGFNGETLIARATPKCRALLQKGLRFLGRFEFVGQSALLADPSRGIKIFDAIDYGPSKQPYDIAKRVILKCFSDEATFVEESRISKFDLDFTLFEEIAIFCVGDNGEDTDKGPRQFCIAVERPQLTLGGVVSGMLGNEDCQTNEEVRRRYTTKVFSVLRIIGKALCSLHANGLVHGNISLTHIGKYETYWKVGEILSLQRIGEVFDPDRFSPSSPPEAVVPLQQSSMAHEVTFRMDLETHAAIDIWAYGKLAFEALVGEPLILFDESREFDDDHKALMDILHWNEFNLEEVADKLRKCSVVEEGVSLIVSCLSPAPELRPSMEEVLDHPVWKDLRRLGRIPY